MQDLSPEIKLYAREFRKAIAHEALLTVQRALAELPEEALEAKYDVGSAEHGPMTQLKLLSTDWKVQAKAEAIDLFWYTAIRMFRESWSAERAASAGESEADTAL